MINNIFSNFSLEKISKAKINIQEDRLTSQEYDDIYYQHDNPIDECTYTYLWKSKLLQTITQNLLQKSQTVLKCLEIGFGTGLNFLTTLSALTAYREVKNLDYFRLAEYSLSAAKAHKEIKSHLVNIFSSPKYSTNDTKFSSSLGKKITANIAQNKFYEFLYLDIRGLEQTLLTDKYIKMLVDSENNFFLDICLEHLESLVSCEGFKTNIAPKSIALNQEFLVQYLSLEKFPVDKDVLYQTQTNFFVPKLEVATPTFINLSLYSILEQLFDLDNFAQQELEQRFLTYLASSAFKQEFASQYSQAEFNQLKSKAKAQVQKLVSYYWHLAKMGYFVHLISTAFPLDLKKIQNKIRDNNLEAIEQLYGNGNIANSASITFNCSNNVFNLYFDTAQKVFNEYALALGPASVDIIYLDGFNPNNNLDLWNTNLYASLAFFAKDNCSLTTFTSASKVGKGLAQVGFTLSKTPGYNKSKSITAIYTDRTKLAQLLKEYYADSVKEKIYHQMPMASPEELNEILTQAYPYYKGDKFTLPFQGKIDKQLINKLYLISQGRYLPQLTFPYTQLDAHVIKELIQGKKQAHVLGKGIAGISIANYLRQLGIEVLTSEKATENKASINPIGLVYPQLFDDDPSLVQLHINAFNYNRSNFKQQGDFVEPSKIYLSNQSSVQPNLAWEFVSQLSNATFIIAGYKHYVNRAVEYYTRATNITSPQIGVEFICTGASLRDEFTHLTLSSGKTSYIFLFDFIALLEHFPHLEQELILERLANSNCSFGYFTSGLIKSSKEINLNSEVNLDKAIILFGATHHNNLAATDLLGQEEKDNLHNVQEFVKALQLDQETEFTLALSKLVEQNQWEIKFGSRVNIRDRFPLMGQKYEHKAYTSALAQYKHKKYSEKVNLDALNFTLEANKYYLGGLGSRGLNLAPLLAVNLVHMALGLSLSLPDRIIQKTNPQRLLASQTLKGLS
ncbi:hypothetical protein CJP74_06235 [Psittacicella melopsittaci]|uniref:MnmC-like methyltransferase domain-containing protein n=1 Tax=Psittacicella melopsittaci TaxID=2028576 RepID=A0A3A1Y6M8_9GAMM|nr:MnmC family methyltransferase [Psittacicella melopsittaci]RIY31767.1 hypothetical protein CJP74_06235 [Psittacicella melopsittaci]